MKNLSLAVGPPERDMDVVWMERFLEDGNVLALEDRAQLQNAIELRKAAIIAGLAHPTAKRWTKKLKKEVEPLLRMRLDPLLGFVVDRWVASEGWWQKIPGAIGFQEPRPGLSERMRGEYDMWKKATPKENEDALAGKIRHPILKEKDAASAKVIKANEDKATEKVLAAVDSLSEKRMKEFIGVERARHTGEKITHHGEDLKFMERLETAEKTGQVEAVSPDLGPDCGNPGMHPKLLKRASGGKHIRE